jgi:hypothetical protein
MQFNYSDPDLAAQKATHVNSDRGVIETLFRKCGPAVE